ncbi:phosphatase PAP2 family protein [Clostridium sp.]|uniref:phosphatase PAP2 family protein n=1 Tax=Clostridium sp. TaxID=1506 RepID=UPI003F33D25E
MNEHYYHGYCNKPYSYQINGNQTISNQSSCYVEHKSIYTDWAKVPYPSEYVLPKPETPNAVNWPLCFITSSADGQFRDPCGNIITLNIKNPHENMSIQNEYNKLIKVMKNLTEHEISIAKYWGDGPPTKQFMPIAEILIDTYGVPACLASRILYILNGALNDTIIVTWKLKFMWNIIRPCQFNPNIKTVLCTPKHPSYPAGHSSMASCMYKILSYFFPQEKEKLYMLATQCSQSRVYAGVHYQADCDEGFNLGLSIGQSIVDYISSQVSSNCLVIDMPVTEYRNANIIPYNLTQYIPARRPQTCDSSVLLQGTTSYTTSQNTSCNSYVPTSVNNSSCAIPPKNCYVNKANIIDYCEFN